MTNDKKSLLKERPPLLTAENGSQQGTPGMKRSKSPIRPPLLADISSPKDEKMRSKVVATVSRFLSNTTSHGLPRIPKARNFYGSIFWMSVWTVAFAVFLMTAFILAARYKHQVPATSVTSMSMVESYKNQLNAKCLAASFSFNDKQRGLQETSMTKKAKGEERRRAQDLSESVCVNKGKSYRVGQLARQIRQTN